jgi:hypothetical protein
VKIDMQRVTFESTANIPSPWGSFFSSNSRYWLFRNYLERIKAVDMYRYVQISDVGNVAFQADPFVWVSHQPPGVHAFEDEPDILVTGEVTVLQSMVQCFGEQAASQIGSQRVIPSGYVIGTAREVQMYASSVADQLSQHVSCQRDGVDEAFHNAVVRSPALDKELQAHIHENRRGPVWTGAHVARANIKLDAGNYLINEDGYRYAVLHQYDQHEALWRLLSERLLGLRKQQMAVNHDCSQFDIAQGDLRGFDLTHAPSDTEKDCCISCLGDASCGSFVYKPTAKHCWLKRAGANVRTVKGGVMDTDAGILKRLLPAGR